MTNKLINKLGIGALTLALAGSLVLGGNAYSQKVSNKAGWLIREVYAKNPSVFKYNDKGQKIKETWLYDKNADGEIDEIGKIKETWLYDKNADGKIDKIKTEIEKNNKQIDEENLTMNIALYPLYFADTTDSRYKQKLYSLKEHNFLTKEEHEKLSKNLGSLNYLIKEKK